MARSMQCFGFVRQERDNTVTRCCTTNPFMQLLGISHFFCFEHYYLEDKLDRATRDALSGIRALNSDMVSRSRPPWLLENELWGIWAARVHREEQARAAELENRLSRMRPTPAPAPPPESSEVKEMRLLTHYKKDGIRVATLAKIIKRERRMTIQILDTSQAAEIGPQCPVCLEGVHRGENQALVLSCSHQMCFPCALQCTAKTCPTCRALVKHGLAVYK